MSQAQELQKLIRLYREETGHYGATIWVRTRDNQDKNP